MCENTVLQKNNNFSKKKPSKIPKWILEQAANSPLPSSCKLMKEEECERLLNKFSSNKLTQLIRKELMGLTCKARQGNAEHGKRIAKSQMSKVANGIFTKKPFCGKGISEAISTHIEICADFSGSMCNKDKLDHLKDALALIAMSLGKIENNNLLFSITAFSHWLFKIKEVKEKFNLNSLKKSPVPGGSTDGYMAIAQAAESLLKYNKDRKIIIVITDGDFDYSPTTGYDFLYENNIEVYGIMIGKDKFRGTPEFNLALQVRNSEELPETLEKIFVKVLRENKVARRRIA